MNWNKIGVFYVEDTYGSFFNLEITKLSKGLGIEVKAVGYSQSSNANDTQQTLQKAVKRLKTAKVFITVLIVHSTGIFSFCFLFLANSKKSTHIQLDIDVMIDELDKAGLLGFPYYYMGKPPLFLEPPSPAL